MMYQQDYLMKMINNLIKFLAKIFFDKNTSTYELSENEEYGGSDDLHKELLVLISGGKINEAENLLFEKINPKDNRHMMVAIDFYQRLNKFDNEFLEENNFSRKEIEEGLRDIAKKAGIVTYKLQ